MCSRNNHVLMVLFIETVISICVTLSRPSAILIFLLLCTYILFSKFNSEQKCDMRFCKSSCELPFMWVKNVHFQYYCTHFFVCPFLYCLDSRRISPSLRLKCFNRRVEFDFLVGFFPFDFHLHLHCRIPFFSTNFIVVFLD